MNTPGDLPTRVAGLANRLRLVQLDFADETPEARQEQLAEEIERALSQLAPDQRDEFLALLGERFPTWDQNVEISARPADNGEAPAPKVVSVMDAEELQDPSFLVQRLVALAGGLSEDQKQGIARTLKKAGIAPPGGGGGGWPEEAAEGLRQALAVPATQAMDPTRTLELATTAAEIVLSLDQLVWNTWKQMASGSTLRRPSPLKATMARFVAGDQDTPRGQVKQDVERLRRLTAAVVASISQAGQQFAQRHAATVGPEAVKAATPKAGFTQSQEALYWKKYSELAGEQMDPAAIERDIRAAIVKFVEAIVTDIR